jgi:hypothetical protein
MVAVMRSAEVMRVLERYLVEVVEAYDVCPWGRAARERGEISVGVLWGEPAMGAWIAEASRLLAAPEARVVMVVAPELAIAREALSTVRDAVAAALPAAGVAEFHPTAELDLATPPRLVPFLRRSPDLMLQLVPLAIIDAVRADTPMPGLAQQASMLGGHAGPPRRDVAAWIAEVNHARVTRDRAAIAATLDDIAADRRTAYARVGIRSRP